MPSRANQGSRFAYKADRLKPLRAFCRCSQERIRTVLASFGPEERADMVEDDGAIRVTCEYCSTVYEIDPAAL